MSGSRFTKRYATTHACLAAQAHYHWLSAHAGPLRMPRLLAAGSYHLDFEFVRGRYAVPADLELLADHLGDAHGAAWIATLHAARLDVQYPASDRLTITDFVTPRLAALRGRSRTDPWCDPNQIEHTTGLLQAAVVDGPAAFYKDTNPRNILINDAYQAVTVDFDDLTLAPFGYDLAKLIVTLAMTHGRLPAVAVTRALDAYNAAAARHAGHLGYTSNAQLLDFADIHHVLTAPYLGRGGYRYPWPTVRPHLADGGTS
jgi:Ser/Thr protein kinase RdoA (MazF antagonist)